MNEIEIGDAEVRHLMGVKAEAHPADTTVSSTNVFVLHVQRNGCITDHLGGQLSVKSLIELSRLADANIDQLAGVKKFYEEMDK